MKPNSGEDRPGFDEMGWIGSAGILLPAYVTNRIEEDLATKKAYVKVLITHEATRDLRQDAGGEHATILGFVSPRGTRVEESSAASTQ